MPLGPRARLLDARRIVVLSVVLAVVLLLGVALGTAGQIAGAFGQSNEPIDACYHSVNGQLRIVAAGTACKNAEVALQFPRMSDFIELQDNLDIERAERIAADEALQAALADETAAGGNADEGLQAQIDALQIALYEEQDARVHAVD